ELAKAVINGRVVEFEPGVSILNACRAIGVDIPTLCHDERLKPVGSCRVCLVEIERKPHPLTACNNQLTDGMVISTHTPALEHERRMLLKMLAQDHPGDGLQKTPEKSFYRYARAYGLSESDFTGSSEPHLFDDSHPYIHVDMSQCIVCYRCVRICDEVQGQFVWQIVNRGHETRIVPDSGTTLRESSCVSCGACVDTCPTGALEDKSLLAYGVPTNWTRTTCPYCGTGCDMDVGTSKNRIVSIKPLLDAPVNRGHLCVKGRYAFDFVSAPDRITQPMIRKGDRWKQVTWDDVISYIAIEKARTILVCGANATENHPIVGARIKQAALRGANLIIIDPRRIELTQYAAIHLQPRPGTNIPLLNAMACTIVEEQLFALQFTTARVAEWDEFCDFIKQFSPEKIEAECGVKADLIRAAARLYASAKPSMCFHGLGVTEHTQGTEGVMCLVNLALLTGNIGKPGTGINPLRGQNNVQGAAHMGCDPGILTGSVSLNDGRPLFESVWGASIPRKQGLNLLEMMDSAAAGKLKALWAIGYDIALTNANTTATEHALRSLDFVIVQDMFMNETARQFGSVFLPAASSFERDGTFMNAERRIQRIRKAIDPVDQSRADW